jgi:hypothetical protein
MMRNSQNLKRRHLIDSQKACVAVEALPTLEEEAKKREKPGRPKKGSKKVYYLIEEKGKSTEHAGKLFGVSHQ